MSDPPVAVYLVREGEDNEELRYSLRALDANVPHSRVVVVGYRPSWVAGVQVIKGNRYHTKWASVPDNLALACEGLSESELLIMNDDFFVLEPSDGTWPAYHRGLLLDHIRRLPFGHWRISLTETLRLLTAAGVAVPLSYELHRPVLMDRERLGSALASFWPRPSIPAQWRTIYGNLWWREVSRAVPDGKVSSKKRGVRSLVVSTNDASFAGGEVGRLVRAALRVPSRYEVA